MYQKLLKSASGAKGEERRRLAADDEDMALEGEDSEDSSKSLSSVVDPAEKEEGAVEGQDVEERISASLPSDLATQAPTEDAVEEEEKEMRKKSGGKSKPASEKRAAAPPPPAKAKSARVPASRGGVEKESSRAKKIKSYLAKRDSRKNRFTPRLFKNAKLELEKRKGIVFKKTAIVPSFFALQQSFYFRSLLRTIYSGKLEKVFSSLHKKKVGGDGNPKCRLVKAGKGSEPELLWKKSAVLESLQGTYGSRSASPSDVADALRSDPYVSKYFETTEIPFGRSVVRSLPSTRKELVAAKKQKTSENREKKKLRKESSK
jgi:hypothetical protein